MALSTIVCRGLIQMHTTTDKGLHEFVAERVLARYARPGIRDADLGSREIAEIGCGHGLLQLQIEKAYGRDVAGLDLNEVALKQNVSRSSAIHCYDIFQEEPALQEKFDLIFLFDALEHITDENGFLNALLFTMRLGGSWL